MAEIIFDFKTQIRLRKCREIADYSRQLIMFTDAQTLPVSIKNRSQTTNDYR